MLTHHFTSLCWDGPQPEIAVTETGPLDLIGAVTVTRGTAGREDSIVESEGSDVSVTFFYGNVFARVCR